MKYTVKAGDTLGKIALKFLGDTSKYKEILKINPQIKDPNKIAIGQIINIPELSTPTLKSSNTNLPIVTSPDSSPVSGIANKLKMILQNKKVIFSLLAIGALAIIIVTKKKKN